MTYFKKFHEYVNYLCGNKMYETINEANLSNEIDDKIKFGISIATHKILDGGRQNYMSTPKVLKDCLESIFNQTYKNFKVYICADCYPKEDEQEILDIIESYPKDQIWYYNLPNPGERDNEKWKKGSILKLTGGTKAWNTTIKEMKSDGIEYIAKIDHDDKWKNNHLETLAKGYTQFPEAIFIATQSRKKRVKGDGAGEYMKYPDNDKDLEYNNMNLTTGVFSHSAVSWNLKKCNYMKYRNWDDQKKTAPRRSECYPVDGDYYERLREYIDDEKHKMIYIPKLTSFYRNSEGKF